MAQKKIIIIDDDVDLVELLKTRLELQGYSVCFAYDGEEGMSKIQLEKPDLIILDVMLPKKDGYTIFREIKYKDDLKNIPIIVLTAKDKMEEMFAMEGLRQFVVKPFSSDELIRKVKAALNGE